MDSSYQSLGNTDSPASPSGDIMVVDHGTTVIPHYSDADQRRADNLLNSLSTNLCSTPVVDLTEDHSEENITLPTIDHVDETPSVQVLFMNTDIGRKYRHEIEKFFHTLMVTENLNKKYEPLPKIQPRPNLEGSTLDSNGVLAPETVIGNIQVYRYFMLDTLGWPVIANMLNQTPGIDLPTYEQQYGTGYFPPPEDAEIVETKPIKTSKKCFNCGGDDHEVKSCPKPFDKKTYQKNRSRFLASGLQYGRYHRDESTSGLKKPGDLSETLRNALGLRDDELPKHIYKMRELGYPPGWLLEAEATNSGLAMFDKHGREVNLDGDLMEDGEVPEHRVRDESNLKYNADKLIVFPGFNAPCPDGVIDEANRNHRMRRMDPRHSLHVMSTQMKLLLEENASRKRSHADSTSGDAQSKKKRTHHQDMEMSDDDEYDSPSIEVIELPPQPPPDDEYEVVDELPPEPPEEDEEEDNSQEQVTDIDATLNALEAEKQKLLAELNQMEENITVADDLDEEGASPSTSTTPQGSQPDASPQVSHKSMSCQVTTPIMQLSEYNKLPTYEKFKDGITEHFPYENLPDATGTYEKMSTVMKTVKEKMATISSCRKRKK